MEINECLQTLTCWRKEHNPTLYDVLNWVSSHSSWKKRWCSHMRTVESREPIKVMVHSVLYLDSVYITYCS